MGAKEVVFGRAPGWRTPIKRGALRWNKGEAMRKARLIGMFVVALAIGFAWPVMAQGAETQDPPEPATDAIEAEIQQEEATEEESQVSVDDEGRIRIDAEIVVVGIRGSLTNSAEIKRSESGVVDAITAEGIGRFPDTNLAESMQRIPGVSIDRRNNEGNQITVRGFGPSFNLVTLNGRQMPAAATQKQEGDSTAEQSRAFNFAEISADSVAGVNVYKTSRADITTGGIGATVDIKTHRPFDLGGTTFAGSIKGLADQSNEVGDDITAEISALYSTTFADGKAGFLLTGSSSARDSRENFVATDGWMRVGDANVDTRALDLGRNPTGQIWMPRNLVVDQSDHERQRDNLQAVLQFQPHYRFTVTLDYTASEYEDMIERSQTGIWFESPNPVGIADRNGSVTDITIFQDASVNLGALDFQGYSDVEKTENESVGLNFEWLATDDLLLSLDMHDSESLAQPGFVSSDFLVILSGPLGVTTNFNFAGGDYPTSTIDDSAVGSVNPGLTSYYDPNGLRPNIDLMRNKAVKNEVQQAQFRGTWTPANDIGLEAVNFGLAYTDYQIDTRWDFDLGVQGQVPCPQCPPYVTLERTHFPRAFPYMQTFNAGRVFNDFVGDMQSFFDLAFTNRHSVSEETTAGYVQADFDTEWAGKPFRALLGLRYEQTDVTGVTLQNAPIAMVYVSTTEFRPAYTDDLVEYSLESDYNNFLPSFDFSMEFKPNLVGRFSLGRTLARPDLNSMKPALSVGDARPGGPYNASQGNPGLEPYESDNIDLSLEWYYGQGSYLSVAAFKKWVDNYVVNDIIQAPIMGADGYYLTDPNPTDDPSFPVVPGGTPGGPDDQQIIWDIATFVNGEDASIEGLEVALQHMFGDSGFGAQLNFTLVDGDIDFDTEELDQAVALTGLSDSANLVLFYEKNKFKARAAYNWRDDFLLSQNQLRQMNEPVFIEEYGQIDARISYDIMADNKLTIFVEGFNISGEPMKAHGRFANQFLLYSDQEPRYTFGLMSRF